MRPDAPAAVLMKNGRRVCRHFFHEKCVSALCAHGTKKCPCCRANFDGHVELPSVEADAKAWFNLVDFDGDGAVQQSDLMEILRATLKIDIGRLERDMPLMFQRFDANSDGKIEFLEMMGPHGLFYHVRRMYRKLSSVQKFIPDIRRSKEAWFRYWDEDGSGALSRLELVRSIVKTFNISSDFLQLQTLRGVVDALWPLFDRDGSGEISMSEFCRPNEGLADVLIHNLSSLSPAPAPSVEAVTFNLDGKWEVSTSNGRSYSLTIGSCQGEYISTRGDGVGGTITGGRASRFSDKFILHWKNKHFGDHGTLDGQFLDANRATATVTEPAYGFVWNMTRVRG